MLTDGSIARLAGAVCLGLAGFFVPGDVRAEGVCDTAWRSLADQRAQQALGMSQSYRAGDRVQLWRLLTLGEDEPKKIGTRNTYYSYPPDLILPEAFPGDPDVARTGDLIHRHELDAAVAAIEALTLIPDPAQSDIATERRLVRSELLFAGVLWTDGWWGYEAVAGPGTRAQRWMALLNAHFMSLPRSILERDVVVNDAYWRAVEDLRWFLRSDYSDEWLTNQQPDDWWLQGSDGSLEALYGAAAAMRESDLLDWLQAMEETRTLGRLNWLAYLSPRFEDRHYASAFAHLRKAARDGALPWQIAVSQWWSPVFQHDPEVARDVGAIRQTVKDLELRRETCNLSPAEQYALGPLRHHEIRFRVMLDQTAAGDVAWRDRLSDELIAKSDDRTRREIARFALAVGRPDLARSIEALRSPKAEEPYGIRDQILAVTAPDLDAFVAAGPEPAALNLLPVRLLSKLIEHTTLTPGMRAAIARMAWTRAYLLDDEPALERITPLLASTNPPLQPLVDSYQSAWTDTGRRRAALALLLKTPAMQLVLPDGIDTWGWAPSRLGSAQDEAKADKQLFTPDHWNRNDGNWWCRVDVLSLITRRNGRFYDRALGLEPNYGWVPEGRMELPRAVQSTLHRYRDQVLRDHPVMRQTDWEELNRLAELPNAPLFLTREATDWARSSWWWERYFHGDEVAEALALSIQATRWGCHRDGPNGRASNAAYRALHELFPDSEAAKNTRYWYN
jgi:hypothetical protein